jgi:hypothetical protein
VLDACVFARSRPAARATQPPAQKTGDTKTEGEIIMIDIYTKIPQIAQWKADSNVTFAIRSHDQSLERIDHFLEEYHRAAKQGGSHCGFVLCDLFLALNSWVKRFHAIASQAKHRASANTSGANSTAPPQPGLANVSDSAYENSRKRYPAVLKLLDIVFKTLGELEISKDADPDSPAVKVAKFDPTTAGTAFGPRYNRVTKMVMEMVSVDMKRAGAIVDKNKDMKPFSANQLAQYRVWFKGGKAYQIDWWNPQPSLKLKPANSLHAFNAQGASECNANFGAFVMTTDLEIYMTKHSIDDGVFHSCYTNQKPVLMAGTMLIQNGTITGVRCDSGHYQPNSHEFRRFLQHLSTLGVSLSRVKLYGYKSKEDFLGMADEFLTEKKSTAKSVKDLAYNVKVPAVQTGQYIEVTT